MKPEIIPEYEKKEEDEKEDEYHAKNIAAS